MKKNTERLLAICALIAAVAIVAYMLEYPCMGDVRLNTKCFLSHIEPCDR
jgi:hypothetical protein